jgi:hypothetical protein
MNSYQSMKNLHENTNTLHLSNIKTSGLTSPIAHGEKKVVDYRMRPGTPHKDEIKMPHINDNIRHSTPVNTTK